MTSTYRELSQIGARIKYFLTIGGSATAYTITDAEAIITNSLQIVDDESSVSGLLKDMGKSVTLVSAGGLHTALYRLVQPVDGAATEGVDAATVYVKVWSADNFGVNVARTG